jgi:hypothetical protein
MWKRVHHALTTGCRRLWRRYGSLRGLLGLVTPGRARDTGDGDAAARARFWDAVREGQREADARCARRDS